MNLKKLIVLFLAMLLPVIIFIFLKSFGKNEFEVAPLFRENASIPVRCQSYDYTFPYVIPDSVTSALAFASDSLLLVVTDDTNPENRKKISAQVTRILNEFKKEITRITYIKNAETPNTVSDKRVMFLNVETEKFQTYRDCIFLMSEKQNAIILDAHGKIRGQYDLTDLDDADRLIMEMKIILKQY